MKRLRLLTVTFIALAGIVVLLFGAAAEARGQLRQTTSPHVASEAWAVHGSVESGTSGSSSPPLAAADGFGAERAVLSHDMDHDGNYDGMADPLAMLGLVVVAVLSAVFLLGALIGDRLELSLCEAPKLSSVWLLVRERPG